MLNNYICALDLGSSKIAASVAEIRHRRIVKIQFESVPSRGMKKGVITDSVALTEAINKLLKAIKTKSGINVKSVYVNMSGVGIITKHSHAVIPLAERGNKVITSSDIQKVNEQARILAQNLEEEIIHQMPFGYTIDSRGDIPNPLGLYSHRLEVDLYLICTKLSAIQNINRIINQAGYDLKSLSFSGLATSNIVFGKELEEGINIFCDIGSDTTELLIFKDGLPLDITILPLGGDDITMELSNELKIPFALAEDTKRTYGKAGDYDELNGGKEMLIKKGDAYKPLPQKLVCELITSRTKLICQTIKDSINEKIDSRKANNFVTVGRAILLEGFLEMLENTLGAQVKIGRIADPEITSLINVDSNVSGQRYLKYIASLGVLYWAFKSGLRVPLSAKQDTIRNPLFKVIDRCKEIYEEYF